MNIFESRFFRFCLIGGIGFLVDSAVLYAMLLYFSLDLYTARLVSYFAAASSTWLLNRHFTFTRFKDPRKLRQWLNFLMFNGVGGVVNYSVYALAVSFIPFIARHPIIGVALGSTAGLIFNYNCARFFVFKAARAN